MAEKTIFLSHIHEESDLAVLIKQAVENEFSGFVDVFVSSDGTSIPAGANFLERIEEGLVSCIGAIYLISPDSVKRPWISFELGAVWIRNCIGKRSREKEIPAIPFCHSGMELGALPAPIGNLNAIDASDSKSLRRAFAALQAAVGGRGELRTDFDALAKQITQLQNTNKLASEFADLLQQVVGEQHTKALLHGHGAQIGLILHPSTRDEFEPFIKARLAVMQPTGSMASMGAGNQIGGHMEELKRPHGMGAGFVLTVLPNGPNQRKA